MLYERLQYRLGYKFGDRTVLIQALTHTSYGHEFLQDAPVALRDNERLEFLGDTILDVIVSDLLLEAYPEAHEGQLSKMRAAMVNERTLAELAKTLHLGEALRLGRGEIQSGGSLKPSILSSALEAVIAAIYLDGGFAAVYPVVRHLFSPLFSSQKDSIKLYDHKTQLQELIQARHRITPTYHVLQTQGPDHAKVFEVEVRIGAKTLAKAQGLSKKEAEQNAAQKAILSVEF